VITELKSLVSTMQSLGYNRKGNNNSKSSKAGRKKNTVETESIENSFGGLHQAFIGVQLFFMGKAQEFAFLEVTESKVFDWKWVEKFRKNAAGPGV